MFKYLDAYTLRARLAPAVIAAAPAFAFVALVVSWSALSLSNTIATIGLTVLLFALSDFARAQGRKIEPALFLSLGGNPDDSQTNLISADRRPNDRLDWKDVKWPQSVERDRAAGDKTRKGAWFDNHMLCAPPKEQQDDPDKRGF
jgi:hypothetical protein